jgi:hypothetical protein
MKFLKLNEAANSDVFSILITDLNYVGKVWVDNVISLTLFALLFIRYTVDIHS